MELELHTRAEEETRAVGRALGRVLAGGELIGLYGPLGAGKTSLVRGLAEGLGIPPEHVRSPSFTLATTYRGGRLPLHHIDLFRLVPTPLDRLALREYMFGDEVCVVEWFDHFGEAVDHLAVELAYAAVPDERRLSIRASSGRYCRLIEEFRSRSPWL